MKCVNFPLIKINTENSVNDDLTKIAITLINFLLKLVTPLQTILINSFMHTPSWWDQFGKIQFDGANLLASQFVNK